MALTGDEPDLQLGDSGEGVMLLQVRLYGLHIFHELPDGTFSMSTETAVRELQSQLGLDNDGVVNRETWEALQHQEQQVGIQYQYMSPYDARDQLLYDMQHGGQRDGWGNLDPDGQSFDASGNQVATNQGQGAAVQQGELSPDGQWRYDGSEWQPAGDHVGTLSPDGLWRWDGTDWQAADGHLGQQSADHSASQEGASNTTVAIGDLSPDGQWRWDGTDWQAAAADTGTSGHIGTLSPDGQWRWDGTDWRAA